MDDTTLVIVEQKRLKVSILSFDDELGSEIVVLRKRSHPPGIELAGITERAESPGEYSSFNPQWDMDPICR